MARWLVIGIALIAEVASADPALPSPLRADDVRRLARDRRAEVVAARERARAAEHRPEVVAALDDPTISVSLDHVPFSLMGVDAGLTVEQRFPLSHVRSHRRASADARARGELARVDGVARDVELEAVRAFWMLVEAREAERIAAEQLALDEQLVQAVTARYTSGAAQADLLRAQIEVSRQRAERVALAAEVRAAEVMLNASIARDPDAPIPALVAEVAVGDPQAAAAIGGAARSRSELAAARAGVAEAEAELRVMRAMDAPMAMVRTGPAYTMSEGAGWMLMVGISIPLWRNARHAAIAEAEAMAAMSRAELGAMTRMVDAQVRAAREQVLAKRARYLALRDEIVPRANEAIAPALAAYIAGQLPLVSVVEAAQSLWMAERELAMARTALGLAWESLRRAAGQEVR